MQNLENTSVASAKDAAPICDTCPRKEDCTFMCENRIDQFVKEEAEADRSLSPKLINQDKYVGIERSHWVPREPMPLSGFAVTISGKTSPKSYKPASEVIVLERKEFPTRTVFPEKFPVPVVCSEFCGKLSKCKVLHTEFEDLCKHHNKTGKLVTPVDIKWSVRFSMKKNGEQKAKVQFAKSTISGTVPEIALAHERTEDNTFAAYSSQTFLDTFDEPEEGHELEYTMDTGMVSPDKSQAGSVPSFMYRTIYRDRKILIGFDTRRVQRLYAGKERVWAPRIDQDRLYRCFSLARDNPEYSSFPEEIISFGLRRPVSFSRTEVEVPSTVEYMESMPVYKWIRIPTLRPIGSYLKPMKVVGSTTIMTRKERKFYNERREVERQKRVQYRSLIDMDEMAARAKLPLLVVNPGR